MNIFVNSYTTSIRMCLNNTLMLNYLDSFAVINNIFSGGDRRGMREVV